MDIIAVIIPIIILIIISIIETTILFKLLNAFLTKRDSKIFSALNFFALLMMCTIPLQSGDIENIIYIFVIYLIIGLIFYKDVKIKKICAVSMVSTISVSVKMLAARIASFFPIYEYKFNDIVEASLRVLIFILIYFALYKVVLWAKEILSIKIWALICTMSLATFTSIVFSIIPFISKTSTYYNLLVIAIMTLYILGIIATFYLIKEIALGTKADSLNKQLKMQMEYYNDIEENQNITNKILHDMKNHLGVINSFLYEDNIEEARSYLNKVTESIIPLSPHTFCENKVVNSILNNKYKKFIDLGININMNIYVPEQLNISQTDLCSIFSNTIDNAIEACLKIQDKNLRYINIKSNTEKGYFVYEVENSKINQIRVNDMRFISNKKNNRIHGYGVDIIRTVVSKYSGDIDTEYTDNTFKITLFIKL
ncbi:GHKL domain-containing protein [Clostridium estertheticum]|uniref:GHKL domain-containing protein n=1 Tax=Clostridium estertheticum TaxID=238834 RepID=A0A5N7ITK3_9CLOT|nr:sensor histidine kinase [Clostridium estertheticum]MPQ33655.1 GHKL domain-containing protein [Clostridium estertheticum]MPQ64313.1 GHKL domain-containing protein [Clostridium estertheticum]